MIRKEVYIVGGGTSLRGFDWNLLTNKDTIVINKSIFYVSYPTYFVTTDYSFIIKISNEVLKFREIKCPKFIAVGFSARSEDNDNLYMKEEGGRIIDSRRGFVYDLKDFNVIIKSYIKEGIGYTWDDFRTGWNSGHSALQLAVLLGYKEIHLLGIDFTIDSLDSFHFHEGYLSSNFPKKVDEFHNSFVNAIKSIKENTHIDIISRSHISRLNEIIPYIKL